MVKQSNTPLLFKYKNWEGKTSIRRAIPKRIYFGKNQWHKEEQWLLEAMDIDKKEIRFFAVKDILKFFK